MSTIKHTPGPWAIGSQVHGDGFNLYSDKLGGVVAWVAPRTNAEDENGERYIEPTNMREHPDAQLIAAAPDLLAALVRLKARTTAEDWAALTNDVFTIRQTRTIDRLTRPDKCDR